jgi:hypothetical protein
MPCRVHEDVRLLQEDVPEKLRRDRRAGAEAGDSEVGPPFGHLPGRSGTDFADVQEELYEFAVPHPLSGALTPDETVVDGFERIVEAFLLMLRGGNTGKILVRAGGAG